MQGSRICFEICEDYVQTQFVWIQKSNKEILQWIRLETKKWYRKDSLGSNLKLIHAELLHKLHNWDLDILDQDVRQYTSFGYVAIRKTTRWVKRI